MQHLVVYLQLPRLNGKRIGSFYKQSEIKTYLRTNMILYQRYFGWRGRSSAYAILERGGTKNVPLSQVAVDTSVVDGFTTKTRC